MWGNRSAGMAESGWDRAGEGRGDALAQGAVGSLGEKGRGGAGAAPPEARGEEGLPHERLDRDAAPAGIGAVHVLVAGRIVQLLRPRPDEDVVVGDLAVVDLGAGGP